MWTSIGSVRFAKLGEPPGPVVLCIGVPPKSISGEDVHTAGLDCLARLKEFDITDVDVEFREPAYTRSVGQQLLKPVSDANPTVSVRGPLTPTLGLRIAAARTPVAEGTGGLYISEGDKTLVTVRHVVFLPKRSQV